MCTTSPPTNRETLPTGVPYRNRDAPPISPSFVPPPMGLAFFAEERVVTEWGGEADLSLLQAKLGRLAVPARPSVPRVESGSHVGQGGFCLLGLLLGGGVFITEVAPTP